MVLTVTTPVIPGRGIPNSWFSLTLNSPFLQY
uniref:Uncharacterized protein n=1 Tax=Rhizophora mucronata TaxID=61149 RepID=A0A2P2K473_RHIMU